MQKSINKIALAGSGNVASHLAKGLFLQGFQITGIWSRDHDHAKELAGCCNSKTVSEISALRDNADMILIAVPDTMIQEIAGLIGEFDGITVHTAGSVPMEVLKNNVGHYGVFYPLQTFSKDTTLALDKVPFLLEASSPDVMQVLRHDQERIDKHGGNNFWKYKKGSGINSHNLKGIYLFGYTHGPQLRCYPRANFAGQNQADNGRGKLKDNTLPGYKTDSIRRNKWSVNVKRHLYSNHSTHKYGYDCNNTNRCKPEIFHFNQDLSYIYRLLLRLLKCLP